MKSAYFKQFAMVAGLILASFLVLGAGFATLSYRYTADREMDALADNASFIGEFTATYRAQGMDIRSEGFQAYLYSLAKISQAHVLLCETDGTIVYSADPLDQSGAESLVGQTLAKTVTSRVIRDGIYHYTGTLGGLYRERRYVVGLPIVVRGVAEDATIGMVFISTATDDLMELWRGLSAIFGLTALAVFALAFVLTLMATRKQTKPVKRMAGIVRDYGRGEFDQRMDETSSTHELNELAHAFNAMADSLAQVEARRSEFVANISHELKTPMTTISGFADGILDGTIPPDRETAALQTISSETKRLARLVRRMLDASRLGSGAGSAVQEQFDIVELTARAMVSLEGKINQRRLDVVAGLPEEPIKVWGDPDAITQVCYNLLDNAIKFSREGGHLWVEVSAQGGKAVVRVRNEGETIPPEELGLIFDRFHKSDKSRSMDRDGVGLGLYIVKAILNEHKEDIAVTSEDGLTEFRFTLTLV